MLQAMEVRLRLPELMKVMGRVLLCMQDAMEVVLCLPEVVRRVLFGMLKDIEGRFCLSEMFGGGASCSTLHAGGYGRWTPFTAADVPCTCSVQ